MRHRFFLQLFRPGDQTLGSADVVEEFPWREGLKVCFSQATCKFSTWRLLSKDRSLAAPLDIFWGFACHELPEKEVDNTWTHSPHGSLEALPRIWRRRLWSIVHEAMLFEHIFEDKACEPAPRFLHTGSMRVTTVLVEGESDRLAVETLAVRLGHDLMAERVSVVPMGGATNIVRFLDRYGPNGTDHRILGLCDAGEAQGIARALTRAGLGSGSLSENGFHVCQADLEDELIRCLGVDAVLNVIAAQGELASFRLLQRQPSQRGKPASAQLRRFFGGRSGNKIRYASLLVDALPAGQAPTPLARLVGSFA